MAHRFRVGTEPQDPKPLRFGSFNPTRASLGCCGDHIPRSCFLRQIRALLGETPTSTSPLTAPYWSGFVPTYLRFAKADNRVLCVVAAAIARLLLSVVSSRLRTVCVSATGVTGIPARSGWPYCVWRGESTPRDISKPLLPTRPPFLSHYSGVSEKCVA